MHTQKDKLYPHYDNDNRRLKTKLKFMATHFGGDGSNIKAKVKAFKKRNNGSWKHCRTKLRVDVVASISLYCVDVSRPKIGLQ